MSGITVYWKHQQLNMQILMHSWRSLWIYISRSVWPWSKETMQYLLGVSVPEPQSRHADFQMLFLLHTVVYNFLKHKNTRTVSRLESSRRHGGKWSQTCKLSRTCKLCYVVSRQRPLSSTVTVKTVAVCLSSKRTSPAGNRSLVRGNIPWGVRASAHEHECSPSVCSVGRRNS